MAFFLPMTSVAHMCPGTAIFLGPCTSLVLAEEVWLTFTRSVWLIKHLDQTLQVPEILVIEVHEGE